MIEGAGGAAAQRGLRTFPVRSSQAWVIALCSPRGKNDVNEAAASFYVVGKLPTMRPRLVSSVASGGARGDEATYGTWATRAGLRGEPEIKEGSRAMYLDPVLLAHSEEASRLA